MYRFLFSRRWIVASVVVLAAVVTMVALGLWQLRRLDEVRASNARVRTRMALPPVPLEEVLGPGRSAGDAVYRRVEASGRYDAAEEVRLDNRSDRGRPGRHLLTPLVTEAGPSLIVDRGWMPLDPTAEEALQARPPSGVVRVVGVLFPAERKGAFGASIPPRGKATAVPRIDVPRLAEQLPYPAYPLYLRLALQAPPQPAGLPAPPDPPDLDEGSHLSYAVQWFLFATVALAVFGALIRREARRGSRAAP